MKQIEPLVTLTGFETILPSLMLGQADVLDYTARAHARALRSRAESGRSESNRSMSSEDLATLLKRYAVKPSQISRRGFENIEIAAAGKDIHERTQFFGTRGREIRSRFYPANSAAPDHLIHVTCTGYISPSPAQHLVNDNGWAQTTNVTHAYHMGCYAALPAIRMAEGFVAARNQKVDIVHTEMCGLHMDANDHSPEQLVVQSLFADGHIKYSAVASQSAKSGFHVLNVREEIIPNSQGDMSWAPASWGMKMTLSRDVPAKISSALRSFIFMLIKDTGYALETIMRDAVFAVHPGGPKIIDTVREILELSEEQVLASREVLFERGNMSSATLPHVWCKLLSQNISSKKPVVSLAFGPGLTVFGALFETV